MWHVIFTLGYYDMKTIVQHELGHALGVVHCHEEPFSHMILLHTY